MRLKNKAAIVTGGARGIGFAIAQALAREGAGVVVLDPGGAKDGRAEEGSPAEQAAAQIRAGGGQAVACAESVADFEACGRAVAVCIEKFGSVDIVVNNAGVLRPKMVWNMPEADWDLVLAVHLKGQFNMIRQASGHMREKGWGRIINMGSEAWRGTVGQINYGAAKGGVFSLTRGIARELGRYGITVNTMCPAAATRLTMDDAVKEGFRKRLEAGLITQSRYDQVVNMGGPEFIAPFACYLASEEAAHINGQAFRVERGMIGIYNDPELRATLSYPQDKVPSFDELATLVPKSLLQNYSNPAPRAEPAKAAKA
jgi:NAD(P)-dependent dehydrogenase (short-subunit alcohol dehydrogenase family)